MFRISCLTLILISGCSQLGLDTHHFLTGHPDFSPLIPNNAREEVQITLVRSWAPTIYVAAYKYRVAYFPERFQYAVEYAIVEDRVKPLKRVNITADQWDFIQNSIRKSGFWEVDDYCAEYGYREQGIYVEHEGQCEELISTDGGRVTMIVSQNKVAKGFGFYCPEIYRCAPFGLVAFDILKVVGRYNEYELRIYDET